MKRLIAPAALLLVVAATACTPVTTNTNTGSGNANTNANAGAAASPTPAGPTLADIEAKERQVNEAIKAKNWDAFGAMLAEDFVLVTSDGVMNKAQTLEGLKPYDLTEYTLSDVRFLKVDADLAVITSTMTEKGSYEGKPLSGKPRRTSTAWADRGGKWLVVYHQDSEVAEAPPTLSPTPAASPAASPSPSASPAASPAAPASATDAEKAVWEAIRAKNADAFAGYLLPDALEVAPEGVFDKAATTKMVMSFDASKFTLSDFKETKIDSDATLVTYKASGPWAGKTIEMYHATIWTNRGGQWRAAFHQGSVAGQGGM